MLVAIVEQKKSSRAAELPTQVALSTGFTGLTLSLLQGNKIALSEGEAVLYAPPCWFIDETRQVIEVDTTHDDFFIGDVAAKH